MQAGGPVTRLTAEEMARLRDEEIFRLEVRSQLEAASRRPRSRLLTFLNSSLGIWLLSTIVVGSVSWNYSWWTERRAREGQRRELIRKLDLEISNRIETLRQLLNSLTSVEDFQMALQLSEKPGMGMIALSVLPEFETRGLRSLLWELQSVVPAEARPEIARAMQGAQELAKLRMTAMASATDARTTPVPAEVRDRVNTILNQTFHLARWRVP